MKRKTIIRIAAACAVIAAVLGYYIARDQKRLTVSEYKVQADISESIRIVQLSDLHNAEFGEGNCELISLVADQRPDLIMITGDMLNRDDADTVVITGLVEQLSDIAPVYYGFGNHEVTWEKTWQTDLKGLLSEAGAVVLEAEYVDTEINGQPLRIGGYMGYYRQPHMFTGDPEKQASELAFADDFEATDRLKILLNHIPTQWVDWHYINKHPVDLVLSGHYHGGVIRLPLIDRGLYAPYVEWFPPFTKGMFSGTEATCILSAGLGSEYFLPRINNPPEIVVVDLIPKE